MNEETEPSISRSVVVTGASRGIGEAVAKAFLAQGDRVAGISRSGEAPDGALALAADVTDPDALTQALSAATEAHGPIEVLVASAGINRESLAARTSSQMWDEVISADLTGTFNTVRAVTPAMMRARRGRIVLVSSAISRHRRRKEALVTPAIGASSTGVGTSSAPMRSGTGERSEVPASWEEGAVSVVVTPPCWHTVGTRVPIHTWSEPRGHEPGQSVKEITQLDRDRRVTNY